MTNIQTPVVVNTDDLTLAELDRATKLTTTGQAGNVTALAFVWLKRDHPGLRLADVASLRQRDVDVTNDDELAAAELDDQGEDGDELDEQGGQTATDPTN